MLNKLIIGALFSATLLMGCANVQNNNKTGYQVQQKISVPGDGGWDYVTADETGNRLFISHATVVQVLDCGTGKLLATIPDTKGVHGIALASDLNKGFISNGKDSSVTVFDLTTYATITKINISGKNPDAILYDPFTHRVFTFNGRSSNATVIDAKENKEIGTIALSGKPEFSATDGKGKVYVNIEDKSELCVIDPTGMKVLQSYPIAPGEEPSGLALDNDNHRLFMVCGNQLMIVLDAEKGTVVAKLPIGDGADGVAYDPSAKCAYSSNGEGNITVVKNQGNDKYEVVGTIPTQKGARTIAVNSKTGHLYLPTAEYGDKPAATADNPRPRPAIKPNTFVILDVAKK